MLRKVYWIKLNDTLDKLTAKVGFRRVSDKLYEPYEITIESWKKEVDDWQYRGNQPPERVVQLEQHQDIQSFLQNLGI
ncbi:hypothetical protein [Jeotgalibacillus soli]|uniref:Uncharacterized protein n=1 Tax=Jeotgalibacillus soli TaxID=889306 RepID=A0A0C2R4U7_9BACL|nr:hypothetical protein [Jeotgalibacillus soli]KIL45300.1 hypothetical protein KP78_28440 [Jeotgalibacillus soli]